MVEREDEVHHRLAIQSVSPPPRSMGREGWRHNQRNNMSHAAPGGGRRVLIIADNPEAVLAAIEPALPPTWNIPAIGAWGFRRTRGGQDPILGSEIHQYPYSFHQPATKTAIPLVDTAPHGVETAIPLAGR